MTPVCRSERPTSSEERCPSCGVEGVRVEPITLKALLTSEAFRRGVPASPHYCANARCDVVYFDQRASVVFRESEVTVPVHAKHPENEQLPVCYCFGHTLASIREEMMRTGSSTATKVITAEVRVGRCACEVRNPKGSCCLGEIAKAEHDVVSELAVIKT